MNVPAFIADVRTRASPAFTTAYRLQMEIENEKKYLQAKEAELKELIESLRGESDEVFAVANLRPYRTIDVEWVREHMPDVYDRLVHVSNTNVGRILSETYESRDQLNGFLQLLNPKLFGQLADISVGDFEREAGKSLTRELEGTAVRTEMRVVSGTRVVIKRPEQYRLQEDNDGTDE